MKKLNIAKAASCLFGGLILAGHLQAEISSKYSSIPARNAFGLKAFQVEKPVIPPPPVTKITLNGLSKVKGETQAYFTIASAKPNEQGRFVNLREGQTEGILELLTIREGAGEVRIKNAGVETILKMNDPSAKPAASILPLRKF